MFRQNALFLPLSLSLLACVPAETGEPAKAGPRPAAVDGSPDEIIGSVNGVPIRRSELPPEIEAELKKIDNEARQRAFHMLWASVDEIAADRLIEQEAKERGMSVAAFRKAEIDDKAEGPSEEELRRIYEANKQIINVPFEVAEPILREQMSQGQREEQREALVLRLLGSAEIRHAVKPPELPRFDVEAGDAPSWGPDDAPVTLIEFSDFECPYCARGRTTVDKLKELYPESLRVVFRDFPLEQHKNARRAAEAAQCADEQDKFWPFHDKLFDNMRALEEEKLTGYAKEVGIDTAKLLECMATDRPKKKVAANRAAGEKYGVDGTPSIFINGIKLIGLLPVPMMQAIIDSELERSLKR